MRTAMTGKAGRARGSRAGESQYRGSLPRARSLERAEARRQRAQQAPARMARSFIQLPKRMNAAATITVLLVVVFLAISIATPLRNYFQQRGELARLNSQLATQQQRKDELTEQLNRYNNDDYVREQARTRLGLIEPGESAFRIVSPKISSGSPNAGQEQDGQDPLEHRPWYQQLWDSIAVPEPATGEGKAPDHVLPVPTVPDPNAPARQPAPQPAGQPGAPQAPAAPNQPQQ
ncbi:FtsB family cell division protein [Corynebacterium heidelbergense]|uniref:Cell division protein n=1 Tax=Corynebacterium heidelbergense TaxID=2055947 RepID=A0A364V9G9_9CORY|nr:septum formation initiator family protein [Corynebacterium heidelbergense]RAV33258.1 cell division protein [Corynebacterium heidelbergense]